MSTMLANSPLLSVCELNSNAQRIGFWYGYKIKSSLIKKISLRFNTTTEHIHSQNDTFFFALGVLYKKNFNKKAIF